MRSDTVRIRPALWKDIEEMILLLQGLFSLEADFQFNRDLQEAGLKQLLNADGALALVAEDQGRVVGMCTGQTVISTAEGGPALLVEDVVVSPDRQGKGIGRILLQALVDRASQQGISRLQLLADRNNDSALAFYEKLGWQSTRLICLRTYTDRGTK
jgi:ribosomal protein S18 acetylase RimI-like enzyme